jgi:glycosyltransferase involved in cell wall biosynthesis
MTDRLEAFHAFLAAEPAPALEAVTRLLYEGLNGEETGDEEGCLKEKIELVRQTRGLQSAVNVLSRLEVALGFRKPSLGLYDNALHFIGGAQKYGCTLAHTLQDDFEVTLIANSEVTREQLESWYGLDLARCRIKVVRLPYFEEREKQRGVFDAGLVELRKDNPFHAISLESGKYDVFVNNCMLEMVYPLAPISEMVVHFPEREISRFFHVGRYTHIIYNSRYTATWIAKRWRLEPHIHIYPPVDMVSPLPECLEKKRDVILSVARFEPGGNKQQLEMIKSFLQLRRLNPGDTEGWRLVLVGGSTPVNPYLERIKRWLADTTASNIELRVNTPVEELKDVYRTARIFWHFSGLGQRDPARIEHFGMTTVEAMQNGCVPVVFRGGGQTEIVEEGVSGFLFGSPLELQEKTRILMQDPQMSAKLAGGAHARSLAFTKDVFMDRVRKHFSGILSEYRFR